MSRVVSMLDILVLASPVSCPIISLQLRLQDVSVLETCVYFGLDDCLLDDCLLHGCINYNKIMQVIVSRNLAAVCLQLLMSEVGRARQKFYKFKSLWELSTFDIYYITITLSCDGQAAM